MFNIDCKDTYLVSIVMPNYNSGKYISESIKSVLSQTYVNFELIIVDDCSSDGSVDIINTYIKKDCRIKLIRLDRNSGPAIARNLAIKSAKGRYIAFLDSDDLWLSKKLEKQIDFMMINDLSFTYSSYGLIDVNSNHIGDFITKKSISHRDMLKTCSVGCLTAIYDIEKIGKMYMPLILKRQDYGLWLEILARTGAVKGIIEPLASYRILSNSVSSNKFKAAYYQWKIYRKFVKLGFFSSVYFLMFYAANGLVKYKFKIGIHK
jgi:teichuronic acid biosynthesis glycosyltransferase TuaG